ncbi:MAG: hypothetical protein ACPG8V_03355 [Alphaproteobacteria bacterium]
MNYKKNIKISFAIIFFAVTAFLGVEDHTLLKTNHFLIENITYSFVFWILGYMVAYAVWLSLIEKMVLTYNISFSFMYVSVFSQVFIYPLFFLKSFRYLITIIILGIIIYLVKKYKNKVIDVITFFILVMTAVNVFNIGIKEYNNSYKKDALLKEYNSIDVKYDFKNKPNVYYLVADSYSSPYTIKNMYNINNSKMDIWLKKQGFYMQNNTHSNYQWTFYSMWFAFTMNYPKYLDTVKIPVQLWYNIDGDFITRSGHNEVVKTFIENGYDVYIESTDKIQKNKNGVLHNKVNIMYEFLNFLNFEKFFNIKNDESKLYFSENIKKIKINNNPKFIYLHSKQAHDGSKGCIKKDISDIDTIDGYKLQLECVNEDIKKTIQFIKKKDPSAFIILQSDHGRRSLGDFKEDRIKQYHSIMLGVNWEKECAYLGRENYTPVNLFPRVFSCLSGQKPNYSLMANDDGFEADIIDGKYKLLKTIENNKAITPIKIN